jgi:hypothetical protein
MSGFRQSALLGGTPGLPATSTGQAVRTYGTWMGYGCGVGLGLGLGL